METVLLVILIILALALIAVVLVQRSEGGALGMGGGGPGGLFSSRGSANLLTRVTAGLAAAFMILSLILVILEGRSSHQRSVMDQPVTLPKAAPAAETTGTPEPEDTGERVPVGATTEGGAGETFTPGESGAAPQPAKPEPAIPQSE